MSYKLPELSFSLSSENLPYIIENFADFPFVKTIEEKAFYNCFNLEYINMPTLLVVPEQAFGSDSFSFFNKYTKLRSFRLDSVTQIEQDAFGKHPTTHIEFSHLESAKSLPQTK